MEGFIFGNKIIDAVFLAWLFAQSWKVIDYYMKEKKINFKKFIETGGMPSSHSSTVVSLMVAVAKVDPDGVKSTNFAISFVLALVVMYDAAGVRHAAGKQAKVINKIIKDIKEQRGIKIIEENLKEILGHTPVEVIFGATLGAIISIIVFM